MHQVLRSIIQRVFYCRSINYKLELTIEKYNFTINIAKCVCLNASKVQKYVQFLKCKCLLSAYNKCRQPIVTRGPIFSEKNF